MRPDAAAAAGHSCGGLQAIELAADPRIKTVLVHNSGVFNDDASPIPGMRVDKAMLERFHSPVIYILGPTDIAHVAAMEELGMEHKYVEMPGRDHGNVVADGMADIFGFFKAHTRDR